MRNMKVPTAHDGRLHQSRRGGTGLATRDPKITRYPTWMWRSNHGHSEHGRCATLSF